MIERQALVEVVETCLGDDLFLVDVAISADNHIVVEIDSYEGSVSIDNCVAITRAVEQLSRKASVTTFPKFFSRR